MDQDGGQRLRYGSFLSDYFALSALASLNSCVILGRWPRLLHRAPLALRGKYDACRTSYFALLNSSGISSGSFKTFSQPELSARICSVKSSRSLASWSLKRVG